MKNIIDIDKLFEVFVKNYIKSHRDEFSADDWEDKLPSLYTEFSKAELSELDGKTPDTYYGADTQNLADIFAEHYYQKVPVSEFLRVAVIKYAKSDDLIKYLKVGENNDLLLDTIEILNIKDSHLPYDEYCALLTAKKISLDVKNLIIEKFKDKADLIADKIIELIDNNDDIDDAVLCEILCSVKHRKEKIYGFLKECFILHNDKLAQYGWYLAEYGDERACDEMILALKNDKIDYVNFKELKLALEALGGEYNEERDFSSDKNYIKIKSSEKKDKENGNKN